MGKLIEPSEPHVAPMTSIKPKSEPKSKPVAEPGPAKPSTPFEKVISAVEADVQKKVDAELDRLRSNPRLECVKCLTVKGQACKCAQKEKVDRLKKFIRGLYPGGETRPKVPIDQTFLDKLSQKHEDLHSWYTSIPDDKVCPHFKENIRM